VTTFNIHGEKNGLTRTPPRTREEMADAMSRCQQTKGQTVLQHGESVWLHLNQLIDHLRGTSTLEEGAWRLPSWLDDYKCHILDNLHCEGKLEEYAVFHDCGKPYCHHIDEITGKHHFPDHAEVSRNIWACVGGDEVVGHLIGNDMMIHTAGADEIAAKLAGDWSCEDSVTLLLTGLAEIHANAKMFGGMEGVQSTNFKMKWKTVDKRGRQILKFWFSKQS
jgi:hypothetical protein